MKLQCYIPQTYLNMMFEGSGNYVCTSSFRYGLRVHSSEQPGELFRGYEHMAARVSSHSLLQTGFNNQLATGPAILAVSKGPQVQFT